MSGLRHGWGKFDDNGHADFVHGGVPVEDFEEEVKHQKKSKKGKFCKRSRTKEPCDFTVVITGHMCYDVVTCSRCGKHGKYIWKHIFKI